MGVGVGGWIVTGGAGRFQKEWRVDFCGLVGRRRVDWGSGDGVEMAGVVGGVALRWAEKRRCIVFSVEIKC